MKIKLANRFDPRQCGVLTLFQAEEAKMARIGKADHARILQLIDDEGMKVAEVAAEYGCTPARLYALLGKLRRNPAAKADDGVAESTEIPETPAPATPIAILHPECAPPADLFSAAPARETPPPTAPTREASPPAPATVTTLPLNKGPIAKKTGVGASLAKPGYGLAMRTAEGDENVTPFRSLEDLLSMVKPMLRAAARSPDAVWFSIRQIDLSMVDYDAA